MILDAVEMSRVAEATPKVIPLHGNEIDSLAKRWSSKLQIQAEDISQEIRLYMLENPDSKWIRAENLGGLFTIVSRRLGLSQISVGGTASFESTEDDARLESDQIPDTGVNVLDGLIAAEDEAVVGRHVDALREIDEILDGGLATQQIAGLFGTTIRQARSIRSRISLVRKSELILKAAQERGMSNADLLDLARSLGMPDLLRLLPGNNFELSAA